MGLVAARLAFYRQRARMSVAGMMFVAGMMVLMICACRLGSSLRRMLIAEMPGGFMQ